MTAAAARMKGARLLRESLETVMNIATAVKTIPNAYRENAPPVCAGGTKRSITALSLLANVHYPPIAGAARFGPMVRRGEGEERANATDESKPAHFIRFSGDGISESQRMASSCANRSVSVEGVRPSPAKIRRHSSTTR